MLDVAHEPLPPAVVNLVTNHWNLGGGAAAATLVDLAARGFVGFEQTGPGQWQCRLNPAPPTESLTPYEALILGHVESRISGGVVPFGALESSPGEAEAFAKRFDREVVNDARSRGYSQSRFDTKIRTLLFGAALVPGILAGAAAVAAPHSKMTETSSQDQQNPVAATVAIAAFVVAITVPLVMSVRGERATKEGARQAARWLGFRDYLRADPVFAQLPPTAVAVWDRNLSYGVAVGAAATAAHSLPFGIEPDTEAWSSYTGQWRLVPIRYPHGFFRWGRSPWLAVVRGLFFLVVAGLLVWGFDRVRHVSTSVSVVYNHPYAWSIATLVIFAVVLPVLVAYGATVFGFGVVDLFARSNVEGQVVRLRRAASQERTRLGGPRGPRCWVAVDDGTQHRLRAFLFDPVAYSTLGEGDVIRFTRTRRLGWVSHLQIVSRGPAAMPGVPVDTAPGSGAPGPGRSPGWTPLLAPLALGAAGVSQIVGAPMSDVSGNDHGARSFRGGHGEWVMVGCTSGPGGAAMGPGPMSMLARLPGLRQVSVAGVRGTVWWRWTPNRCGGWMMTQDGQSVVGVALALPNRDEAQVMDAGAALVRAVQSQPAGAPA